MSIRFPSVAGMFYPAQEAACRHHVAQCLRGAEPLSVRKPLVGGMVPHAGWTFSGPTAGRLFGALKGQDAPETIVLFGAVHSWGVTAASLYAAGSWRTPLGDVAVDAELAAAIVQANPTLIIDRPEAHASEHSIEVQLPFVQYLFPSARILPLATPPLASAPEVGRAVARAVRALGRQAVGIGSSDLTHYGPRYGFAPVGVGDRALEWARQNDARLLDVVVAMRAPDVLLEAEAHQNACGAGAIAAAVAFAAELGATQGILLQQTTSHEVMPAGRPTDFVGYGAVAFF